MMSSIAETVLAWLGTTSVQVALLVVCAALVQRFCGRHLTPRWRYGLWGVVLVRLALPPLSGLELPQPAWSRALGWPTPAEHAQPPSGPDSQAASPSDALERLVDWRGHSALPAWAPESAPESSSGSPSGSLRASTAAAGSDAARPSASAANEPEPSVDRVASARERRAAQRAERNGVPPLSTESQMAEPRRSADDRGSGLSATTGATRWPWRELLFGTWLAGTLFVLASTAYRARALSRRLRRADRSDRARPDRVAAALARARERIGVGRPVGLVVLDDLDGPCVTGLSRPVLLWPRGLEERLDDDAIARVLRHEMAHVRHGDVATALAVHLVSSLYWFHPLVRVALSRFRAAQESVRDWEALAADPSPAPTSYARTLVALADGPLRPAPQGAGPCPDFLDGGRDLKRRVHMIQRFGHAHRAAPVLGLAGLALLVTTGFARFAAPDPVPADPTDPARPSAGAAAAPVSIEPQGAQIQVERAEPEPEWWAAFQDRLAQPISLSAVDTPLSEVLDAVRVTAGVNIVERQQCVVDYGDPDVSFEVHELPVRDLLNLIMRQSDGLTWTPVDGAVYVYEPGSFDSTDLRFYSITPFIESSHFDAEGFDPDELMYMVQEYTSLDDDSTWEQDWVSIEVIDSVLAIRQCPVVHDSVVRVLEHLLEWMPTDGSDIPVWMEHIERGLVTEFSVDIQEQSIEAVARFLQEIGGFTVLVDDDFVDLDISLQLQRATVGEALRWIAREIDAQVRIESGAVVLTEDSPGMELRFHELGSLLEAADSEFTEVVDFVENAILSQVDPELWDRYPEASVRPWRQAMLVVAPPSTHERIANLLAALERALKN